MDALERAQALAEAQGRVGLLKQDTHWHNEAGRLVELASMSTIRLLEIRSELERYAFELAADTLVEDCSPRDDGLPTGEELVGALTGQWVIDLTPEEWLASTALSRRLAALIDSRLDPRRLPGTG